MTMTFFGQFSEKKESLEEGSGEIVGREVLISLEYKEFTMKK